MTDQKIGFDNEKYLKEQSESIVDRATQFGNRLYLEFEYLYDIYYIENWSLIFDLKIVILTVFNLFSSEKVG